MKGLKPNLRHLKLKVTAEGIRTVTGIDAGRKFLG